MCQNLTLRVFLDALCFQIGIYNMFRSSALGTLLCVLALFSSRSAAQLVFTELESTARVEASSTNSQDFEFLIDEDERTLMSLGSFIGDISASSAANGGSAFARSEFDIVQNQDGFKFVSELTSQVTLGGALGMNATSGAAITAVFSTEVETDIAISGAFILDQDLPGGTFGSAIVDVRVQLFGAAGSIPDKFVNLQYVMSSLMGGMDNELRFIDITTIAPDGEYALLVQATVAGGAGLGVGNEPVDLSGRFTMRLDYLDDDGDGLFNTWEEDGVDFEIDGVPELDLPGEGADSQYKDLFVELDVQNTAIIGFDSIDPIIDAFLTAPVENPNGIDGIKLHMDLDELGLPDRVYEENLQTGYCDVDTQILEQRQDFFGTFDERGALLADDILKAKSLVYRYGVIGGSYIEIDESGVLTNVLGFAELSGDDFIVTVPPSSAVPVEVGLTIMHELGHNLGLRHGGCDDTNYKPNYFSVMNYMHSGLLPSFPDVWNEGVRYDYSRRELPTLDETFISEPDGIGEVDFRNNKRYFYFINDAPIANDVPNLFLVPAGATNGVDWNVDFDKDDVGFELDLNRGVFSSSGELELLHGHDDWNNLHYKVRGTENFGLNAVALGESTLSPGVGEISIEELEAINSTPYIILGDEPQSCLADLTGDGVLNFFDVSAFLGAYSASDPIADFTGEGIFNFFDVSAFLMAYSAGCP